MASEHEIRVGVPVSFKYGVETVQGIVKEERGPIGRGGRRLYLIKFNPEPFYETMIELPADQLQVQRHSFK
jgi:hypothetical protein